MSESKKPVLHASGLQMFCRCQIQYEKRYVAGIIRPPGVAMLVGTSVHKSSEVDLISKRDKGELLSLEAVQAVASDCVKSKWEEGVALDSDEQLLGEKIVKGEAVDSAVTLASLHHKELAPKLIPKCLERPFEVELVGFPVNLGGIIDVQTVDGGLRDLKTRKAKAPKGFADTSIGLTVYSLAIKALDGEYPQTIALDFLLKKKQPELDTQFTTRGEPGYRALLKRIELVCRAIQSGIFTPCAPDSFWCCPAYCGWHSMCEFGAKSRVQG